ncbi:MAG: DegT/DnrJ/EryC1/StrS family aminotransferase [Egibacteraceae bacterium]
MASLPELAIMGGRPARSRPDERGVVRVGAAAMADSEINAVAEVLRRQILYRYHGGAVADFEARFAGWVGVSGALAVNSGTSALYLAFSALDLEPGGEVLVPTVGFVSVATTIAAAGAVPRFVPVDDSLTIDLDAARQAVTDRTRAVLAVHAYGAACDIEAVRRLAETFGGAVVEDVAQACGASVRGRRLGTFGDIAAFSFQDFKLLSTGEGGMVVTNDAELLARCAFLHDSAAVWAMPEVTARVKSVRTPPLNLRMSEVEGAIGLVQLDRADGIIRRLRDMSAPMRDYLDTVPGVRLRPHIDGHGEIATSLVFSLAEKEDARWVAKALRAEGVNATLLLGPAGTNRHWAGDWGPALKRCGIPLPDPDLLEADARLLSRAVVVPMDIRHSDRDVEESLLALQKVFGR